MKIQIRNVSPSKGDLDIYEITVAQRPKHIVVFRSAEVLPEDILRIKEAFFKTAPEGVSKEDVLIFGMGIEDRFELYEVFDATEPKDADA